MWALIAFILLGVTVAALIEFNERRKAKKSKVESQKTKDDCAKKEASNEDCSACELMAVCDKKSNNQ